MFKKNKNKENIKEMIKKFEKEIDKCVDLANESLEQYNKVQEPVYEQNYYFWKGQFLGYKNVVEELKKLI